MSGATLPAPRRLALPRLKWADLPGLLIVLSMLVLVLEGW